MSEEPDDNRQPPRNSNDDRRSPPQFSLRALFVVVTLVAVVCAYFAWPLVVGSAERQSACWGKKNSAIFLGMAEVKKRGQRERHEWKAALIVGGTGRFIGFGFGTDLFGHQGGYKGVVDEGGRIHVRIDRYEGQGVPVALPRCVAWVDEQGTVTHIETDIDGEAMQYVISKIDADSNLKQRLDDVNGLEDFHTLVKEILANRKPDKGKTP